MRSKDCIRSNKKFQKKETKRCENKILRFLLLLEFIWSWFLAMFTWIFDISSCSLAISACLITDSFFCFNISSYFFASFSCLLTNAAWYAPKILFSCITSISCVFITSWVIFCSSKSASTLSANWIISGSLRSSLLTTILSGLKKNLEINDAWRLDFRTSRTSLGMSS